MRARSDPVVWAWSGGIGADSARVKAKVDPAGRKVRLLVTREASQEGQYVEPTGPAAAGNVWSFQLDGLRPGTRYSYGLEVDGELESESGSFQTFALGASSFKIAFSSCARTGSASKVFDTIAGHQPLLFLHLGDFHSEDFRTPSTEAYRAAYDRALRSPAQARLYRSVPIVYVWDDQDYGARQADRSSPGREAVQQVYREIVPHYPLPAGDPSGPIYHAFSVGRVRFVVTDSRSRRTPRSELDTPEKSVLGEEQKTWFKRELLEARDSHGLIVWVNTSPWIAAAESGADHWGGYTTERLELARFIRENEIRSLLMLSGGAHMLAIDDGSHNYYIGWDKGFPVFHAAALDKRGSQRGGPYSHGPHAGGGHFGLMEVRDQGGQIEVVWSGRNQKDRELLTHQFTVE